MKKSHLSLSDQERQELTDLLSKGQLNARTYKRAQGLLLLDQGHTHQSTSELVGSSVMSVKSWAKRYKTEGLSLLFDKPRSGRPRELDSVDVGKITALASTNPPEGYERWSLRLLSDRLGELGLEVSHTEVGKVLKRMNLSLSSPANKASKS